MNLVLIGPMGAGKSSVAHVISQKIGWQVFDTDKWVRLEQKCEISDIFAQQGESFFRQRESAALDASTHWDHMVISTGGGIIVSEYNRQLIAKLGYTIWLTASEEVLFERVSRNKRRPLLLTENPRATLQQLLHSRNPIYEQCADVRIDTTDKSFDSVATEIIDQLKQRFSEEQLGFQL